MYCVHAWKAIVLRLGHVSYENFAYSSSEK